MRERKRERKKYMIEWMRTKLERKNNRKKVKYERLWKNERKKVETGQKVEGVKEKSNDWMNVRQI